MSGSAVFQSPGTMDNFNPDFTPDLDYLDGDGSFDFDNADLGGEMIGGLPGLDADGNPEQHEKRKNTDEDGSPEEGDAKRQELGEGEKGSKKPGRKPLTNEPTTVSTHFLLPRYHSFSPAHCNNVMQYLHLHTFVILIMLARLPCIESPPLTSISFIGDHLLTTPTETQSAEPCCATRFPGTQRETSQRSGDSGL